MDALSFAEAGKALAEAVKNNRTGFVARVNLKAGMAALSNHHAIGRRAQARIHMAGGNIDYMAAATIGTDPEEVAAMASERRAVLSEMLVYDVLRAARVPFRRNAFVDHVPMPGCDLEVVGCSLDIKAAGQASVAWSHQGARGKLLDDRNININYNAHEGYCAQSNFAGYVCVYFYIVAEEPIAADIFVIGLDGMGEVHSGSIVGNSHRDMRHYRIALPFPDSRYSDMHGERIGMAKAAAQRATKAEALAC